MPETMPMVRGPLVSRRAVTPGDLARSRQLRAQAFGVACEDDPYDARCAHLLIEDRETGELLGCLRMRLVAGADVASTRAARDYDLARLRAYPEPLLEIGRFCVRPGPRAVDVLRLAWAALASEIDAHGVGLLIGCTSFPGTDPRPFTDVFAILHARHLAPRRLAPGRAAPEVHDFAADAARDRVGDGMRRMPPLLRSYLRLGAWVSDHAVLDRQMGTLYVLTGLEVASVPPERARLLHALRG